MLLTDVMNRNNSHIKIQHLLIFNAYVRGINDTNSCNVYKNYAIAIVTAITSQYYQLLPPSVWTKTPNLQTMFVLSIAINKVDHVCAAVTI